MVAVTVKVGNACVRLNRRADAGCGLVLLDVHAVVSVGVNRCGDGRALVEVSVQVDGACVLPN